MSNRAANDESLTVYLKIVIEHLDWVSIKKEESETMFTEYKKNLGLFVIYTNLGSELSFIKRIDTKKIIEDDETVEESGRFETIDMIKCSTAG